MFWYIVVSIVVFLVIFIFIFNFSYKELNIINSFFPRYIDVYDPKKFGWTEAFRASVPRIKREYTNFTIYAQVPVHQQINKDVSENIMASGRWNTIFLRVFSKDTKLTKYFPKTMELVNKCRCTLAFFSILAPKTTLTPHVGVYQGVIRYHLCIKAPENYKDCYIIVNNKKLIWEEGKDIMFDDMFMHEVHNNTDEERVVLFLDIQKEFNDIFLDCLNSFCIKFVSTNDILTSTLSKINSFDYKCSLLDIRNTIFPLQMEDITTNNGILQTLEQMFPSLTSAEVRYLAKYDKFMQSDVYSFANDNTINVMFYLLKDTMNLEGAIVEAGTWRGGMSIWLSAIMKAYGVSRTIYIFDTFARFPQAIKPRDKSLEHVVNFLFDRDKRRDLDSVKNNFKKFDQTDNIIFVPGFFEDTMPTYNIPQISLLYIDCDYYESTLTVLTSYYKNVVVGGVVVVDDYNNPYLNCKDAVDTFRAENKITGPLYNLKEGPAFWFVVNPQPPTSLEIPKAPSSAPSMVP